MLNRRFACFFLHVELESVRKLFLKLRRVQIDFEHPQTSFGRYLDSSEKRRFEHSYAHDKFFLVSFLLLLFCCCSCLFFFRFVFVHVTFSCLVFSIAITLMIFVNYGGGGYYFFGHAVWNGKYM